MRFLIAPANIFNPQKENEIVGETTLKLLLLSLFFNLKFEYGIKVYQNSQDNKG